LDQAQFASVLEAAQAGAEWAWSRLYNDIAGPVLGYLRTRGAVEPEDLVGEVFLQVARNLGTFRGDYPAFRSWVFTVAHHRVVDERRYRTRRPVDPGDIPEGTLATGNTEAEALEQLATDEVIGLLATLTAEQRDVLLLRVVGDLSVDEVAKVVGRRPGAVKALQRRGLDSLRRVILTVTPEGSPSVTRAK
jgi:RNA polymerase sigma factor (sigma-70 family)